jgi:hypothetical protein
MTRHARLVLQMMLCCAVALVAAPAAQASFGVTKENFEAGTCEARGCTYASAPGEFFTQAAGHPEWGITAFELNHTGSGGSRAPEGQLKRIRVDVPPGLAADPQTLPGCPKAQFEASPATCAASLVGETELEAVVEVLGAPVVTPPLTGQVYNLEQSPGLPLEFGINVEAAGPITSPVHLFLEGHVSDAYEPALAARGVPSGDYHEYFEINNVPTETTVLGLASSPLKLLMSKLLFKGRAGHGNFLTLPSICSAATTSYLEVESYAHEVSSTPTVPPVGISGCGSVPFKPTAQVKPESSVHDGTDGAETVVTVPQHEGAGEINTADIADAHVLLPEGLTMNPSAGHGLEACTPAQIAFGSASKPACPAGSKLGTVTIETDLPPGSLTGSLYLAAPKGLPIGEPPFTVYLAAESIYAVSVKLEGKVEANRSTGRLEVSFVKNPQLPFSELKLKLNGGVYAPLANPLGCGPATTNSSFLPYSSTTSFASSSPFATTGCPASLLFAPTQSTTDSSSKGGAFTSFTFNAQRAEGQQYLSSINTTLPAGLVGLIPSVKLCQEPQAAAGSCASTSQVGTVTATAGSGTPYGFSGPVYLTGPTGSAPYGLSIPIEAKAGPIDLGRLTTRIALNVDPHTARVIASGSIPTIFKGVPLRLRTLSVAINKPKFLFNPSNCGALSTDTVFGSSLSATKALSTPFQVNSCSALAFKPVFSASSPSKTSRANGASLIVSYTQPATEANIKSVVATLPSQLPSRLTTLHQACPEATFAANPKTCPAGSLVGTANVGTPVLPEKLTGPAYLVSHGGAAFPNLVLILEGDHGVRVILEGTTNIKKGITTSTFASVPDVPVSSFELNLPVGPHSALGSFGSLCSKPLYVPIGLTAQNGATMKQKVRLSVGSCHIKLLSHRIKKHTLIARVQVFTAGRLSLSGKGLHTVFKKVKGPGIITIKAPISIKGRHTLAAGGQLKVRARAGFNPRHKNEYHSAAFTKVTFRH